MGPTVAGAPVECFDPRSRARSDASSIRPTARRGRFRSALPCEERRLRVGDHVDSVLVSIRAPVRGATTASCPVTTPLKFRSALPCEERRDSRPAAWWSDRFDPRSRARSDAALHKGYAHEVCFDPRSRARSDDILGVFGQSHWCFDPRSRARSDMRNCGVRGVPIGFRSALPCEERPRSAPTMLPNPSFDPRSRARSDPTITRQAAAEVAFRSALPCEERLAEQKPLSLIVDVSIRAPVRGATTRHDKLP